jgi:cytidylate kinase
MHKIITIDGPSGAGKTTVAKLVAERLGLQYIPSGKLYRAVAYQMLQTGTAEHDPEQITAMLVTLKLTLQPGGHVLLNGQDVTDQLQTPEVGSQSSIMAQNKQIRQYLTALHHNIAARRRCVIEGRSTAIEIFPQADLKIWLTADEAVRIHRKSQAEGDQAAGAVMTRDEIDKIRQLAPMQKAADAVVVDTTHLTAQAAADQICTLPL